MFLFTELKRSSLSVELFLCLSSAPVAVPQLLRDFRGPRFKSWLNFNFFLPLRRALMHSVQFSSQDHKKGGKNVAPNQFTLQGCKHVCNSLLNYCPF